ncbi:MAG TPA: prolyl oligopeptidase family serine peptidase [Streptosporangiaceae bacterium]|nr:prolyl oligopeptidase family serine peptidase [Streptosporangiaceae bacterium]
MLRLSRYAPVVAAAALLAAGIGPASPAFASAPGCGGSGSTTTVNGALPDTATYEIQCPAGPWNGTLFLYSHGYVTPGSANPAHDVGDPVTGAWLLGHGYALAGSSYATTGWAIQQALPDQIATLDAFGQTYRKPDATIAWGHSLGGIITAGLIQRYPGRFAAAMPMCGVLAGGVATWNTALDSEFAFQQLLDPSVRTVNITDPAANLTSAEQAVSAAQQTAQGRARIALAAALGDTPGWFTPLSPEPAATDYSAQEQNQLLWDTQVDFPFVFAFRAELEARAGGNPSWTTGVDFASQLRKSADFREVTQLYRAAGLSLGQDLRTLNRAAPVTADPQAVRYLRDNISFDGQISIPVLSMHTIGDGLVVPENEQAYASVVRRAGNGALLRQTFVSRAGHCAFTPAETVAAVQVLLRRLATGHWDDAALRPASLNASATALGPGLNIFASGGSVVPTPAAFVPYNPTLYLRPYDLGRFDLGRFLLRR